MASRSDNLPRRFARIYTAAITDVMDELGLQRQTLPWAIQPLSADMRLAGYAFTARGRPYRGTPRDRDATLRLFLRMLGAVPADSVLVLASGDNAAAHFGELSAQWFRSRRSRRSKRGWSDAPLTAALRAPRGSAPGRLLAGADLGQPCVAERLGDVVADPLRVPPLDRCHRHPVDQHLEVEVVAHRESRRARASELLALRHRVAHLDLDGREVGVEGLEPQTVVDDHGIAVDRERLGEDHDAAIRGRHGRLPGRGQVVAIVHLRVDLTAAVAVAALLGEVREDFRPARLNERPLPERRVGGRRADSALGLLRFPPEVAVDDQEAVHEGL